MGDTLKKIGHEFQLGPVEQTVGSTPDMNLGGVTLPGSPQTVSRPSFISAFLQNLQYAIPDALAYSQGPGGGAATGLAGVFQGQQHRQLVNNQMGQQQLQNQLSVRRENREQQEFEGNQQLRQQTQALGRFSLEHDPQTGAVTVFDKQKMLDSIQSGQDPRGAFSTYQVRQPEDINQVISTIFGQAGLDETKFTPKQKADLGFAKREALRTSNPKPVQDFLNRLMQEEATANTKLIAPPSNSRGDRSYQYHSTQLDKIGQPITDRVQRLGNLQDAITQKTPQADALIVPELLTVMAGGQGSGLRMNEAEISRIVGGRANSESLKAALNKWKGPGDALSITDAQRSQIQALVTVVRQKLDAKQQILDEARQQLIGTDDPMQHRKVLAEARRKLTLVDMGAVGGVKANAGDPMGLR